MTLSVSEATAHISYSLRSGTSVPKVGALRILNDAGQYLANAHTWNWLLGGEEQLDFAAGQNYVNLPDDFRDMVAWDVTTGLIGGFIPTTHQQIVRNRTSSISFNDNQFYWALTHASRAVRATGTFGITSLPSDGESMAIDDGVHDQDNTLSGASLSAKKGTLFTFSTTAGTIVEVDDSREVVIGATAAATAVALTNAINAAPRLQVRATDSSTSGYIDLEATKPGLRGHDIQVWDLEGTFMDVSALNGARLTGGLDGGPQRARLDLWPTPDSDTTGAVTIYYRAGWTVLDDDSENVLVPEWLEPFYLEMVRACARGYEMEDEGGVAARMAALTESPAFMRLRERDDSMQPDFGRITNGAALRASVGSAQFWNFPVVADQTP